MKTPCDYCNRLRNEADMLNVVALNLYFCNQQCFDGYKKNEAVNARDDELAERRLGI